MDADEPVTEYVGVLVDQARRARRRRRMAVSAALLAAIGTVVVVAGHDGPSPAPPASPGSSPGLSPGSSPGSGGVVSNDLGALPHGAPPQRAYVTGTTLHLPNGEVRLDGTPHALLEAGSSVVVQYQDRKIVRIDVTSHDVEVVADTAAGPPAIDPGGRYAAWQAPGPGPATVVVRSLNRRPGTQTQTFPATPVCCDDPFYVEGITGTGQLVAAQPVESKAWVWDLRAQEKRGPGHYPTVQAIRGLGGFVTQVTAHEVVVRPLDSDVFVAGTLAAGTFEESARIEAQRADFADPSERRIVYVKGDGDVHVQDRRPGVTAPNILFRDIVLELPDLSGIPLIYWEDADHVLLDVSENSDGWLVRCDVGTRHCETAARFEGSHLVAR